MARLFAFDSQMDSHRSLKHVHLFARLYHGLVLYHHARDHLLDLGRSVLAVQTSHGDKHCNCPKLEGAVEAVEGT